MTDGEIRKGRNYLVKVNPASISEGVEMRFLGLDVEGAYIFGRCIRERGYMEITHGRRVKVEGNRVIKEDGMVITKNNLPDIKIKSRVNMH